MYCLCARDGAEETKVYLPSVRYNHCIKMALSSTKEIIFISFFLFLLLGTSSITKAKELTIVGAPYEPFLFVNSQGQLQGFDVDLINLLCTSSGYRCKIQITTFKKALERLKNGTADIAIGAIYITEERKKTFLFTRAYLKTGLVAVIRVNEQISLKNLSGKTVGVKLGATGETIAYALASEHPGLKIKKFLTTEDSFEALIKGNVDFILNDYLNSVYLILQRYPGKLTILKGVLGPVYFQKTHLAYPIRKDLKEVQERFNQSLRALQKAGILSELKQRWLGIMPTWNYVWIARTFLFIFIGMTSLSVICLYVLRQREVRRQAKNLQSLLKELPGAVFVVQNKTIVFSNPAARHMFNMPTLGLPIDTVIPLSEDLKKVFSEPLRATSSGKFEFRHKGKVYMCYYNPIEFYKKPSIQLLIFDITSERKTQESLKRLYTFQEAYNNILQKCSEAETVEDILKGVLEELLKIKFLVTKKAGAAFIFDEKKETLKMIAHIGIPDEIKEKCSEIKEGECLCGLAIKEKKFMFIPSSLYPVFEHHEKKDHGHLLIPIYDEHGPLGLLNLYTKEETKKLQLHEQGFLHSVAVVVRDSIRRIKLRNILKHSLETFHLAVENMPLPVVIYTQDGTVVHANKKFKDLVGTEIIQISGLETILKRILQADIYNKVSPTLYKNEWTRLNSIELITDDKKRLCNISYGPVGTVEGEKNFMFVLEDITEEEILKKQLLQSQKLEAVGRLAGGVAHDFNNIIGAVVGHAELALNTLDNQESVRAHLEGIILAAQRASLLTNQLLAFSRKQVTKPRPIHLNATIEELLSFMERILGEDIKLEFLKEEPLPFIFADPMQIEQIILNLLINARDAMPEGGKLTIRTNYIEDKVVLTVEDTGHGIPEDILDKIFEPFFTTKPEGKGTGLGLSTVYAIVQDLGGKIEVYSTVNKGTTFMIYLPPCETERCPEEEMGPEIQKVISQELSLSGPVVVVEDDPDVREVLRGYLEALGIEVIIVEEPERALESINKQTALLITDLVMPGINGLTIAEEALKINTSLKVLFITGFIADERLLKKVEQTKIHVLAKPFNLSQLIEAIKKVIS